MDSGYDADLFVDPIDPDYICPVCTCVVRDPVSLPCDCVGKIYCAYCIKNLLSCDCPTCRSPFLMNTVQSVKFIKGKIESLRMKCQFHEQGCKDIFMLGKDEKNLKEHREKCVAEPVQCTDCTMQIIRLELKTHQETKCPNRLVACNFCEESFRLHELKEHQKGDYGCDSLIACPNQCIQEGKDEKKENNIRIFKKIELTQHLLNCTFRKMDCDICTKQIFVRDLSTHLQENLISHLTFLATEVTTLKKINLTLTERVNTLEYYLRENNLMPPAPPQYNDAPPMDTYIPIPPPLEGNVIPLAPPLSVNHNRPPTELFPPLAPPMFNSPNRDGKHASVSYSSPPPFVSAPPPPPMNSSISPARRHSERKNSPSRGRGRGYFSSSISGSGRSNNGWFDVPWERKAPIPTQLVTCQRLCSRSNIPTELSAIENEPCFYHEKGFTPLTSQWQCCFRTGKTASGCKQARSHRFIRH